jgi:hypothetical protein
MASKKTDQIPQASIAAARERAKQTRAKIGDKPGRAELLTENEISEGAPFYFVLRNFIAQLKEARTSAGLTLEDVSVKSGLAIESLSRLETGALTNPTWKTLGLYASAIGVRPRLEVEGA